MEIIIRALNNRDLRAVCDLSAKIWNGKDYLANVAKDWIQDGGFYGLELDGKIVGTAKMTLMPNRVVWLEGLRVLPEFQKNGYGKKLADFMLKLALKLVKKGKADLIEFSTYYKNEETISMALAAGFQEVDKFYLMSHKPVEKKEINLRFKIHPDTYKGYPSALPFGWKFLHPNMKSLRWLNKQTNMVRHGENRFFVGGEQPTVSLVTPAGKWVKDVLPIMQFLVGEGKEIEIMLPVSRADEVKTLLSLGFKWWEKDVEDYVVVYRYFEKK